MSTRIVFVQAFPALSCHHSGGSLRDPANPQVVAGPDWRELWREHRESGSTVRRSLAGMAIDAIGATPGLRS